MNTKLKQTGVMGITALLMLASIATIPGFIGEAEAKIFKPQYVVLAEAEADVKLSVKQISEQEVDVSQEKINHLKIKSDFNTDTFQYLFLAGNISRIVYTSFNEYKTKANRSNGNNCTFDASLYSYNSRLYWRG